jgi:catechol 2,3-dioxygenase-like lactoylglutathione lyase family enzyme
MTCIGITPGRRLNEGLAERHRRHHPVRRGPRRSKEFYGRAFALPVKFEDDASAVFEFGGTLVNLLKATEADELIAPVKVAQPEAGARFQLALGVDNVDATCRELTARGVELLNGPMDRPWGIRTASFRDPGGHIWEIAR